jgi:hypothetical protein
MARWQGGGDDCLFGSRRKTTPWPWLGQKGQSTARPTRYREKEERWAAMEFWAECKEINRKLFCEFWVVELNRFKLNLNYFKPKF